MLRDILAEREISKATQYERFFRDTGAILRQTHYSLSSPEGALS